MIDTSAFMLQDILTMYSSSSMSGSAMCQHVPSEPINDSRTGSLGMNLHWWNQQARSGQNLLVTVNQPIEIQQNAVQEKIETIKSVFSMTENEIAEKINVSRKTLFNWKKKESAPNKAKAQRIFDLYMLAKDWKNFGFTTDKFDLESPVIANQSVKDLLNEDKLDSEKILFAGNRLSHKSLGETELF